MNVLVIGSSGQVGSALFKQSKSTPWIKNVFGTYKAHLRPGLVHLDLQDPRSIHDAFEKTQPQAVIHCSALTAVDYCEDHPEEAHRINVLGTEQVLKACQKHGARLITLSTDYVFDGKNGPYGEEDPCRPLSVYGRSKWEAEQRVLTDVGSLVIRSTVIYSYDLSSLNFLMQLIKNLSEKRPMQVPNDQVSNPTYAPNLAEVILRLINKRACGIYHVVGPDWLNRYEFALQAAEVLGLDKSLITPQKTSELNQRALRPLEAGLKTDKVRAELGCHLISVKEGVSLIREAWERETSI
ncbi:MAG: SDR family oxidoreductase [Elusimicrobia bacterium]|nr:SDR family oxidoreductase [Elusimicrobiota bacterium]